MTRSEGKTLYLAIMLAALIAAVAFACVPIGQAYADGALNWNAQINVNRTASGYSYTDGSITIERDSLGAIFEDIEDQTALNSTVRLYFNWSADDVSAETIVLSGRRFEISGRFNSISTDDNVPAVFTVASGASLTVNGLTIESKIAAFKVSSGATFMSEGANINVVSESRYSHSALDISGTAEIKRADIRISFTNAGVSGAALKQSGGEMTLSPSGSDIDIKVQGPSACEIVNGTAVINGGTFIATESSSANTFSGSALMIDSNGVATVNGGQFGASYAGGENAEKAIYLNGEELSSLTFNGGAVDGDIYIRRTKSTVLSVADRDIRSTAFADVKVTVDSSDIEDSDVAINLKEGYRTPKWQQADISAASAVKVSDLAEGENTLVASNLYSVRIVIGDYSNTSTYTYNERVDVDRDSYAENCPEPLRVKRWSLNGSTLGESVRYVTVTEDIELVAELELPTPLLGTLANVGRTYNGEEFKLSVGISYSLEWTLTWQKYDEDSSEYVNVKSYTELTQKAELALKNVSDSGKYRLSVSATVNVGGTDYSTTALTNEAMVICSKKQSVESGHVILRPSEGEKYVYDPAKRLSDYTSVLPAGYSWYNNSALTPTVPVKEYAAEYLECDDGNYSAKRTTVTLDLKKATYSGEGLNRNIRFTGYVYDEDKTLADFSLAAYVGYYWTDNTITPVCNVNRYAIYYNADPVNYENYTDDELKAVIILDRKQALGYLDIEVEYRRNLNGNMVLGDLRSDLPQGYYFNRPEVNYLVLPAIGRYDNDGSGYVICYNPDPVNYNPDTNGRLYFTLNKGLAAEPEVVPTFRVAYNPLPTHNATQYGFDRCTEETLANPAYDPAHWSWGEADTYEHFDAVKTYTVIAYFNDEDPDFFRAREVSVTFEIVRGIPDVDEDYEVHIAYYEGLTLGDVVLNAGYEWQLPADTLLRVGADQAFTAVYYPDDSDKYEIVSLTIKLTVDKGNINMVGFSFIGLATIYDGKPHSLSYSGNLPVGITGVRYEGNGKVDAGSYLVKCYLEYDRDTYNEIITEYLATLSIARANPIFIGDKTQIFVQDGKPKSASVKVNNNEQTISSDRPNSFIETGSYNVVFSVGESKNYKAGSYAVTIIVKRGSVADEDGGIRVEIIDAINGIEDGISLTVTLVRAEELSIIVRISVSGTLGGSESVIVTLPAGYDASALKAIRLSNGETVAYEAVEGSSDKVKLSVAVGEITLEFKDVTEPEPTEPSPAKEDKLPAWAIALICIGSVAVVAAGVCVAFVLIKRKRKKLSIGEAVDMEETKAEALNAEHETEVVPSAEEITNTDDSVEEAPQPEEQKTDNDNDVKEQKDE